jgi:GNAT superfamily N-acetyltransferase
MGIKDITGLLSSVGFSSPPNWLRPFHVLSNGEQFRVTMARALAESPDLAVIDEFTSVVDRTVAQIGSAAIAKVVRRRNQKLVAVSCHYDIIDWLQPDWVYEPQTGHLARGCLRRPGIQLEVVRVDKKAWKLFKHYHYLDANLNPTAKCFVAYVGGRPAAFAAVISFPHPKVPGWREHRAVCLPEFQGVGIGTALSNFVASMMVATGKPYFSSTSHPGFTRYRAKSTDWKMIQKPIRQAKSGASSSVSHWKTATTRLLASFEYVGTPRFKEAKAFALL